MRKDTCDFIRGRLPSLAPLEPTAEEALDIYLVLFGPFTAIDTAARINGAAAAREKFGDEWAGIGVKVRDWLHKGMT